ncbi:carbonic anhydrase 6 [Cricetulus griseus]
MASGPGLVESIWSKEYPDCGGLKQSPINLQTKKVKFFECLKPTSLIGFRDDNLEFSMTNNGHTVQITLPPTMNVTDPDGIVFSASHMNMHWGGGFSELRGSEHTIDGVRSALEITLPPSMQMTDSEGIVYKANQLHMHWGGAFLELSGSEHTINGIRRVIEIHIVHFNSKYRTYEEAKSQANGLSVLAILIEAGDLNTRYAQAEPGLSLLGYSFPFNTLSSLLGQTTTLTNIKIQDLFPGDIRYYFTYNGSLTTPPCTENVKWFLFRDTVKLSKAQVLKIETSLRNHHNQTLQNIYRQIQPLNHRAVEANFPPFAGKCK